MTCPKCDGELDANMVVAKWGDGEQRQPIAPFICSLCGSLMILDISHNTLLTLEAIKEKLGLDAEAALRSNEILWRSIEMNREIILSLPNRRPVLR